MIYSTGRFNLGIPLQSLLNGVDNVFRQWLESIEIIGNFRQRYLLFVIVELACTIQNDLARIVVHTAVVVHEYRYYVFSGLHTGNSKLETEKPSFGR